MLHAPPSALPAGASLRAARGRAPPTMGLAGGRHAPGRCDSQHDGHPRPQVPRPAGSRLCGGGGGVTASVAASTGATPPHRCVALRATAESASPPAASGGEAAEHRCRLCVSTTAATPEGALEQMRQAAAQGANVVELRLDLLGEGGDNSGVVTAHALEELLAQRPFDIETIVTYRPAWEGGNYRGDDAHREAVLAHAMELGVDYVDVELKALAGFLSEHGELRAASPCKLIASHHNFEETPPTAELQEKLAAMAGLGCDIAKVACMANDIEDTQRIFDILSEASAVPTIAISMSGHGLVTRVLGPQYGSYLTFATLEDAAPSAPGQPPLKDLLQLYRLKDKPMGKRPQQSTESPPQRQLYGVIGNPIGHSMSPAIHNAAMHAAGVDTGGIYYVPLLVTTLRSFLATRFAAGFGGFSVTIPFKEDALACCSWVDPLAARIGAVNTLVRDEQTGALKGYNTDCHAAIAAVEAGLPPRNDGHSPLYGRTAVVLGAGGAARALAFGAADKGAEVVVVNRSVERAQALAADVAASGAACRALAASDLGSLAPEQQVGAVLMNTTPVGMSPRVDASPVPSELLAGYALVFDAIYNPLETRLLADARRAGCAVVSGLDMFIGQAAAQFELFFEGQAAPAGVMRAEMLARLGPDDSKGAARAAEE